ncbi:hypothetical protein [Streptomyces sp. YS415]|uniref:hypothetical protein n=1 Tax=Streptomyces sp. YS415 TaxID=2944806 RepID=UPI00201FB793|nr:hypothetical protein [Streptomyces sp. YS415]MCL7427111.1 hypothetical protein [Streptomyces sp. YS415]
MRAGFFKRVAVAVGAFAAVVSFAAPASAATSYAADECTSSGNAYCFVIHYNSRSATSNYSASSCFVANRSIPDYYGYSPNGAILVRFVFDYGLISGNYNTCRLGNSGEGLEVKNNAASASNGECVASYRVYYSSGYQGVNQTFSPTCGDYWPSENLSATLKNENASAKRL